MREFSVTILPHVVSTNALQLTGCTLRRSSTSARGPRILHVAEPDSPSGRRTSVVRIITEGSADDLMHRGLRALLEAGDSVAPTKGPALELRGVTLELTNPLARLSRSESRGRLFSSLGELCWYLSGSNQSEAIAYYISGYHEYDENGQIYGAYGPRLFDFDGIDQVRYVIDKLTSRPFSRQAVIQLFDHEDVGTPHKVVPCTCTLQFMVRHGGLQLITHMRSNDAYVGLPHDIFAFTMLQELVARTLGVPLGTYVHMVGSFHLYEADVDKARAFLREGWQSSTTMPEMPEGDPWPAVENLLTVARSLQGGLDPLDVRIDGSPYWQDLARILVIYALLKADRLADVEVMGDALHSEVYDVFIADKTERR